MRVPFLSQSALLFLFLTWLFILYIPDVFISKLTYSSSPYHHTAPQRRSSPVCQFWDPSSPFVPSNSTWRDVQRLYPLSEYLILLPEHSPGQLPFIQFSFLADGVNSVQHERRDAVQAAFDRAWSSYREYAWMKDELAPLSAGWNNRFGGWGVSVVDALDTLWIMDLKEDFYEAVEAVVSVDFSDPSHLTKNTISVFETNIRFLGGLLAAYEVSECEDVRLLEKAVEVGDMLSLAFDTPNHIPTNNWSPRLALEGREQPSAQAIKDFASLTTLFLEFTRLSQITGDSRYFSLVQRIANILSEQQTDTKIPGLWPKYYTDTDSSIDLTIDPTFTIGAEADSGYEYLLKIIPLLGGQDEISLNCASMFIYAMETASTYLFFRPMTPENEDILLSGKTIAASSIPILIPETEHLSCFLGGTLALASALLSNSTYLTLAEKLTRGCAWAYRISPTGIAPEIFKTIPCPDEACLRNSTIYDAVTSPNSPTVAPGITHSQDPRYLLRPEAIESVFYMYRITGSEEWRDIAWEMWEAIDAATWTDLGNAELRNVFEQNESRAVTKVDRMESFWLAETLKYFYLVFGEHDRCSLDEWVFNTEAHPLRIVQT